MRFERIQLRGMGPFKGTVAVDLAGIEGQLVAICGENGAGKTTLLELLAGALYRACPTRGTLAELATARDSFVEVSAVNGKAFTVRQLVDGVSGKAESLVRDADGSPLIESAKVSHFDKWAAEHVTPADVLYASQFAAQGSRGFLDMRASERKALLIEILGLKRLERMAEDARERARTSKATLDSLSARLGALVRPDLEALEKQGAEAEERVRTAVESVRGARVALDRAKAAAGDAARQAELAEQRRAAEQRLIGARRVIAELQERIANNRAVAARGDEIRAAIAQAQQLDGEIDAAREAAVQADQQLATAKASASSARGAEERASEAIKQSEGQLARLAARLRDRADVESAGARLLELRAQAAELEQQAQGAEERARHLDALLLSGKDTRIEGLRDGLGRVAHSPELELPAFAAKVLTDDDELAAQAAQAPDEARRCRVEIDHCRSVLREVSNGTERAQQLAARAGEMAQAQADQERATTEREALKAKLAVANSEREAAGAAFIAAEDAASEARARVAEKRSARSALEAVVNLRARLEQAEARIEELSAQLPPASAALAQAEAELATLPVIDAAQAVDLGAYERTVANAEASERTARDQLTHAVAAIERAQATLASRSALEQQMKGTEAELADWTRLAQDLGKDGLQAMELDAALPEWTTIANSLLHSCLGPRFTIELRTDRMSADGKKVLEDLEARVIDTVSGRDADATTYSGGELVLVGSALSLALTTLACRRSGVERPTICLDEAGAALDAANGRAWIAMLRMAARSINADKVLYISHSTEAQEMADARIWVGDGKVTVQDGGDRRTYAEPRALTE